METAKEILRFLWGENAFLSSADLHSTQGERVQAIECGEYCAATGGYCRARLRIGFTECLGEVTFNESLKIGATANLIAQVVDRPSPFILREDGSSVTQIIISPPQEFVDLLAQLKADAQYCYCKVAISAMEPCHRMDMFNALVFERLERKCREIDRIFIDSCKDWNQTFYAALMANMSGNCNKQAYTELAHTVPCSIIYKERNSIRNVEALLLGASGLLSGVLCSSIDMTLHRIAEEMLYKYDIQPMSAGSWQTSRILPANRPQNRIMQVAALMCKNFLLDRLIHISTLEELHELFRWSDSQMQRIPQQELPFWPDRLGNGKIELLGINLVVPLLFCWGKERRDEEACVRAIELLEQIPAEKNTIIRSWSADTTCIESGMLFESAFQTQAILQLNNEYCRMQRCVDCIVCRNALQKIIHKGPFRPAKRAEIAVES